jgi:uncharacterized metal-binding protein
MPVRPVVNACSIQHTHDTLDLIEVNSAMFLEIVDKGPETAKGADIRAFRSSFSRLTSKNQQQQGPIGSVCRALDSIFSCSSACSVCVLGQ